jgi:nucleotide-binding universal stress UspA family protein
LGDPGSGIGAFAREQKMDLIMMPTRGLGRFRTALLGSVTAKTLHCATCPVWTDSHCEADHQTHVCWRNILCAVDTDAEGGKLIRAVAELTAGHRVTVRLVHAVAMPAVPQAEADPEKFADYTRFTDFLKYEAMQTITQMQKEADTHFHVLVGVGNVTDVIRHSAINHNADVVVIGRGVLSKFAGGLRSEVSSIVRSMPCPVLSV